jgi:hypothetical protein
VFPLVVASPKPTCHLPRRILVSHVAIQVQDTKIVDFLSLIFASLCLTSKEGALCVSRP